MEYILEYYSLVREGKTNCKLLPRIFVSSVIRIGADLIREDIATTAFHDVTGVHPTEPDDFFRMYAMKLRPKKKVKN
jgi:hypothetical protein